MKLWIIIMILMILGSIGLVVIILKELIKEWWDDNILVVKNQ